VPPLAPLTSHAVSLSSTILVDDSSSICKAVPQPALRDELISVPANVDDRFCKGSHKGRFRICGLLLSPLAVTKTTKPQLHGEDAKTSCLSNDKRMHQQRSCDVH
jgi:hypothetical protein